MPDPPLDPVAALLKRTPTTPSQRADAWDAFESSTSPDDLATKLSALKIPQSVKADLWDLKTRSANPPDVLTPPDVPPPPSPTPWPQALMEQAATNIGQAGAGAIRGAIGTVQTLAKPIRWATGMAPATPPPAETTTAGRIGHAAEQIGEVLLPAGKIATVGELAAAKLAPRLAPIVGKTVAKYAPRAAVEAAGQAGIAAVQGGDPRVAAALGAAVPALGATIEAVPTKLKEQATKQVMQALGPTKEHFKTIAEKLVPKILQRGLGGSREALQEQAATTLSKVGSELDAILAQHATQPVGIQPVVDALETAKDAFRTTTAAGKVVEYEPRAIKQLNGLQTVLTDLGPTPTVEQLVAVRRAWDTVVSQAGGFTHRASGAIGVPLKDISEAWAKREATGAIRNLLATDVPDLATINKEWAFWKSLDDVLRQTLKRTQPQGMGLGRMVAGATGAAVGGATGASLGPVGALTGAAALAKVADMAKQAISSPGWRFASAKIKDQLADAIVANDVGKIVMALTRITSVQGSKVGQ
jgi:hypothetical protein